MLKQIKKVAIDAAYQAGKTLIKEYDNFDRGRISLKSRNEIVTKADLLSEEIIIKAIKKNFPTHSILSEEIGFIKSPTGSAFKWIIDPIDGTTNFSIHNPLWCISIGIAEEDEIVFGIIYAPLMDELFIGEKGEGASLNGKKFYISKIKSGKIINTLCYGKKEGDVKNAVNYFRKQKLGGFDCRQFGSAALELAYVGTGRIETCLALGANLWDIAAGVLIVREAGGKVTDLKNQKWNMESRDLLASNGLVHEEILKVLNK